MKIKTKTNETITLEDLKKQVKEEVLSKLSKEIDAFRVKLSLEYKPHDRCYCIYWEECKNGEFIRASDAFDLIKYLREIK